jgi:glycerol dehydrogenase
MITTTIFPGRYVQGYNALNRLGREATRFGESGLIICDPFIYKNHLPEFRKALQDAMRVEVVRFEGECCDDEINRLLDISRKAHCDVIVGIGGGKTLDTAKAISFELKTPVITCPTITSTDAPTSAVSVIYTPQESLNETCFLQKTPTLCWLIQILLPELR